MKSKTVGKEGTTNCHFCEQQRQSKNVRRLQIETIDRFIWIQLCSFCLANELQALKDEDE